VSTDNERSTDVNQVKKVKKEKRYMKKYFKKLSLLMAIQLLIMVFAVGCGEGVADGNTGVSSDTDSVLGYEPDENTPAWQLDHEDPVTLTWYVNADWWNTDFGEDYVTKKIVEDTNITIEFIAGDDTKLNAMFASDDVADIITVFDTNTSLSLQAGTWAYPLNELADKYDPYFYKAAKEDILNWYRLDDGNVYTYPNYANSQEDYDDDIVTPNTAFIIRKDVYKALGEPDMKTQEEFLNALGRIKEEFPDIVPLGWTGDMVESFQNYIGVPVADDNGDYYYRNLDDDYLSWIKTFNDAYREGYITDDIFADDDTTLKEKIQAGKYACIFAESISGVPGVTEFKAKYPDSEYIAIDGPVSTVGNEPILKQGGPVGWMKHYISKECEQPEKAIQLFTYLISEYGQIVTFYGVEGETYTVTEEGYYQYTEEVNEMKVNDPDMFSKTYRFYDFFLFGHDRYANQNANKHDGTSAVAEMEKWGEGKLSTIHFLTTEIEPDVSTQEARNLTNINTKWDTAITSLIRAESDDEFEAVLTDFKEFMEANGWDAIYAVQNEKMQANRERLGW